MQNPEVYVPATGKHLEKNKKPMERIADRAVEIIKLKFLGNEYLSKKFNENVVRQIANEVIKENRLAWKNALAESTGSPAEAEENRAKELAQIISERIGN